MNRLCLTTLLCTVLGVGLVTRPASAAVKNIYIVFDHGTDGLDAGHTRERNQIGGWMNKDLVDVFARFSRQGYKAHLINSADEFKPATDSYLLNVRLTEYNAGSKAMRIVVGFGAGGMSLKAQIELLDSSGNILLSKEESSYSGREWRNVARKVNELVADAVVKTVNAHPVTPVVAKQPVAPAPAPVAAKPVVAAAAGANTRAPESRPPPSSAVRAPPRVIEPLPPVTWPMESVAVVDLAAYALSEGEVKTLSVKLHSILVQTKYFHVLSRSDMKAVLEAQQFQSSGACDDSACLVQMGKILAVQKIVGGSIGKVGGTFSIALRLVDVETGKTEISTDRELHAAPDRLFDLTEEVGNELARLYAAMKTNQP